MCFQYLDLDLIFNQDLIVKLMLIFNQDLIVKLILFMLCLFPPNSIINFFLAAKMEFSFQYSNRLLELGHPSARDMHVIFSYMTREPN